MTNEENNHGLVALSDRQELALKNGTTIEAGIQRKIIEALKKRKFSSGATKTIPIDVPLIGHRDVFFVNIELKEGTDFKEIPRGRVSSFFMAPEKICEIATKIQKMQETMKGGIGSEAIPTVRINGDKLWADFSSPKTWDSKFRE